MITVIVATSYTSIGVRLTEMIIGKNVSGYTASRSGRLFDEVRGVIYVSRPNLWVHFSQPFAACSDLKPFYGGQPADVRLLASPRLEGDINLLTWSPDAPDRITVLRLRTSIRRETLTYRVPGFRLYVKGGKVMKRDTEYVLSLEGDAIECEEEDVRVFSLGAKLGDPVFVWTGREIWVLDGRNLYAYRKGKLVRLRTFKGKVYPTSNGEGTVAFYSPDEDRLFILKFTSDYRDVRAYTVRDVSKDVRGEFVSIHTLREVKKEGMGDWVIVLTFRKDGKTYYITVKREGDTYTVESAF